MKEYKHLTREGRYQIYAMKKAGLKQTRIAEVLQVDKSTVSRELARNSGQRGYRPKQAQEKTDARKACNAKCFDQADWDVVEACLKEGLSPEQISGRLGLTKALSISHEAIYLHVYKDKREGGELHKLLRCQKKRKKRYGSGRDKRGKIVNRVDIDQRPAVVEERSRIGDWEGDLIIGKSHQGAVVTLVERKSRYALASKVPSKEASPVSKAIEELLGQYEEHCHTLTFDNGREFALHEQIAKTLTCQVFFAKPYHSWERGCNENTNGLLRQYLPKHSNLKTVCEHHVQFAVNSLNHRPRKCLGWRTPHEVFHNQPSSWLNHAADVALHI
jgi:transposase, IS30 family